MGGRARPLSNAARGKVSVASRRTRVKEEVIPIDDDDSSAERAPVKRRGRPKAKGKPRAGVVPPLPRVKTEPAEHVAPDVQREPAQKDVGTSSNVFYERSVVQSSISETRWEVRVDCNESTSQHSIVQNPEDKVGSAHLGHHPDDVQRQKVWAASQLHLALLEHAKIKGDALVPEPELDNGECAEPEPELAAHPERSLSPVPRPCRERCFTSTGFELGKKQKLVLEQFGCKLVDAWNPCVTHLIADTFRRTTKMMCAIASGADIITPDYLVACSAKNVLIDVRPFALRDTICEAAFARKRGLADYSLAGALDRRRQQGPLLKDMSVFCLPSVSEKRELPLLVVASGGNWLEEWPSSLDDPQLLLLAERVPVSADEGRVRKTHKVFDVELLREAACTQVLRKSLYRIR